MNISLTVNRLIRSCVFNQRMHKGNSFYLFFSLDLIRLTSFFFHISENFKITYILNINWAIFAIYTFWIFNWRWWKIIVLYFWWDIMDKSNNLFNCENYLTNENLLVNFWIVTFLIQKPNSYYNFLMIFILEFTQINFWLL